MTKSVRRAEWVLIIIMILAILLPQLLGSGDSEDGSDRQGDIASVQDLNGKRACTVTGSNFAVILAEQFPDTEIHYVNDWADECIQVDQGRADFLLWEESSLPELYEEYPALMALPDPVGSMASSWCTPRTPAGEKLRAEINTFLAELRQQGLLEKLYRKWADQQTAPDHVDDFPMAGEPKGTLKIVTSLDWAPVSYQNGTNPCGYLIELLYRFCAWGGYTADFDFVDIQSALAGFSTGKYDLIGYGLQYQEEAAESMYFTDPVMEESVYAVISRSRYAGTEGSQADGGQAEKAPSFLERLQKSLEKNFIREDRWKRLLSGLGVTLMLSFLSILFGTALGAGICAMHMSRRPYPCAFARIYIKLLQGTPIVVLLLVLYYIIFGKADVSAFWVCVLGLSLDFSAYASEIFRSGIEAVPAGQARAARALGFRPAAAFVHVVLPQMVVHCLPVYIGQMITTVKMSSVAGYISVQDLTKASDLIRSRTYEAFFPLLITAVIYYLITWLLTLLLKQLEKRIDPARRKRQIRGVKEYAD
jgi:polar amino acid transport system substrate-binding protein